MKVMTKLTQYLVLLTIMITGSLVMTANERQLAAKELAGQGLSVPEVVNEQSSNSLPIPYAHTWLAINQISLSK